MSTLYIAKQHVPASIALPAHGLELIDQSHESAVVHLTKFDRLTQLDIEKSELVIEIEPYRQIAVEDRVKPLYLLRRKCNLPLNGRTSPPPISFWRYCLSSDQG